SRARRVMFPSRRAPDTPTIRSASPGRYVRLPCLIRKPSLAPNGTKAVTRGRDSGARAPALAVGALATSCLASWWSYEATDQLGKLRGEEGARDDPVRAGLAAGLESRGIDVGTAGQDGDPSLLGLAND